MSAQSAKKKRFGSRRRAANQNEISKGDEFHTTDSTFVAQYHIPEENTESLNEVASPDNSQSETQPLPSPELSGNRRKLGSSRRNKRQHVKDSETESHHNPREEVGEKTRGEETTETKQMSLVIQHKRQEELSQGAVDMSATHDESLYSAITPHHPSEVQNSTINYAEADLESLIPKSENLQVDQDENETNSRVVSDSCKLVEYMHEGNDKSDTLHSEDVKESEHLVGISELTSLSVLSCPTVDPQLIYQLNSREMPEEKFPNMYSNTEKDSNERDDNTELLKQHGNLQGNFIVSESHVESVAMQFSTTPVITTEKISSRENTDTECSVWQAAISTAEEVLHTDEEQNEHFNLSEVRGDHQSEDAENKVREQKIKPTEIHEITSEMLIHDATENPEIISENLTDQTDMSGTQQPEFIVKITDDCLTSNEISSSDSKQDEHHTDESNAEALEEKNEDYHVYHTKKPPISDIGRVDTVLGQVYEMEGQVEDDIKPSVEQTGHQEKDRLFYEMEESESPLRTLKSEINSPFDSQHQQDDTGFNPLGNRRKLGSSRRNKGRQHVKDPDAESYHKPAEDVVGNTRDNEPLETTEMLLTIKTAMQGKTNETMLEGINKFDTAETEDVGDQVKENALGTDLHSSSTVDQQTIDQSNIRKLPDEELPSSCSVTERDENAELLKQWGILQSKDLVSEGVESSITSEITTDNHDPREHTEPECSVEQALFSLPIERLPTNEEQNEHFNLSEVRGDRQSEDAESKVHKQEVKPTEMPQTEYSSEMLIHDATENPEITAGNLIDKTEVNDTHQSELSVNGADDSPFKQDISNPDDKQDERPMEESNFETLEQNNEDYHIYDTKKAPISDIERVDTAQGQVYEMGSRLEDDVNPSNEQRSHQEKEGHFDKMEVSESSSQTLQSEINAPFASQHHTRDNESLETTEMSLTTETAVQEKTNETMLEGTDKFNTAETEDVSDQVKEKEHGGTHIGTDVPLSSTVDQQTIDQSNIREMPDDELTNVCSVTERKEIDENTKLLKQCKILQSNDLMSEGVESSITSEITTDKHDPREHTEPEYSVEQAIFSLPKDESPTNEEQNEHFNLSEVSGDHQSEDAESKVHEQEIEPTEMLQTEHSSEMLIHDATENPEITSENLTDQTEVNDTHQSELSVNGADDSPFKQDISNPDDKQDERPMEESNFETLEQNNEDYHIYDTKKAPISDIERVDTAQGQVYEMGSRLEDDVNPSNEQRSHQEKEGHFDKMEVSESSSQTLQSEINAPFASQHHTRDNESLETTEMSLTTETAVQEKTNETMLEGTDKFNTAETEDVSDQVKEKEHGGTHIGTDVPLSSTVDQQTIDQSNIREMPDDELTNVCSVTERKEIDENTKLLKQCKILQSNDLMSEGVESSITSEITTDKHDPREHTEPEYSVEQAIFSLPKDESPTNEEQNEHFNLSEVSGDHQSEDAESKVHEQEIEPTEMLQTEHSSEMLIHDATENPEITSENLTDQTEVSDTHQSEWVAKRANDSPLKQDISNPDNQQDGHLIKESNFEVLEQKKEDNHAYDIKTPPISGIERVDTALSQVYEMEGQLEDDIKPSDEQTGHQKKGGLFSEMEESESSLQTLQSDTNAPFDSQHQQDDTGFNRLGNRRKLGSSRRNRGRRHVKDSDAESHHEPTEDVVGNTRDNEPLETTEMSLTIETAMQGERNETMLEGIDKFDTAETEDVGDQVKENKLVGTDVLSSSTVDQQTIDQSNIRKIPDEELPSSCSVTERKERDENTELLQQWGILQSIDLVSEGVESSIASEITTDKHDPREHTEPEYSVEHALFSLPKEESPTNEEQNEHFNLSEVSGDHQSQDAESKVHKQEIKPTEMPQTEHSSEMLIHDATENPEITSGNLTDHTEVSDTHQSELIMRSANDSSTNQEISNPDDKEDEHHTEESNVEPLEQKNEDYHVYDTKKAPIGNIERVDTALGQVSEVEGQVEDDVKPSDEQTDHQEKEGLFSEIEESESSLQTLQSEVNSPFDSQHQQNDTGFNPLGNRRKLGSSRRNRGRRHVKDPDAESYHEPTEDVVGNTRDNEPLETTEMSLTTETAMQEKTSETMLKGINKFDTTEVEDVGDQVKENEHVVTLVGTDLHSSSTVDQQTIDQSNIREMPDEELPSSCCVTEKEMDEDTELLGQSGILQSNDLVSEDVESSITSEITTDKYDPREHTELPTNEEQNEHFNLSEVSGDHQSQDAESKVHEQEIEPTEMPQTEYSSEMLIQDATENPEIISENLTDQTEVSDAHQSELSVNSADDSPFKQEILDPNDKEDEHHTEESNFETSEQKHEEYNIYDTKTPPISNIERVDTVLGQVYEMGCRVEDDIKSSDEQTGHQEKEAVFSEMEESESSLQTQQSKINSPFNSQHQQNEKGLNPLGNRKKLGSSRRNKGRQHVKDPDAESYHKPAEDVVGNTRDNEPLETTEMSLTIKTAMQGKTNETMLEGTDKFDTAESEDVGDQVKENALGTDIHSSSTEDQQTIDQLIFREMPDKELPDVRSVPEKESKDRDEDTELLRHDGNLRTNLLVSELYENSADLESSITSEITTDKHNPREHTEPEVRGDHQSEDAVNIGDGQEVKQTQMLEMPQIEQSSERLIHDATENLKITSGDLTDQTEVSDTHQSELIMRSANDSSTNQEILNPDEKQDEHHTKESNTEALEQINEHYHVYDTKTPPISDIERVDTAFGQVYEMEGQLEDDMKPSVEQTGHQEREGVFSEMEENESSLQSQQSDINARFDSQHQQNDTGFNPLGNRRKLGSSRRNRGRRHVKDSDAESYHEPTEDVVGNTRDNEPLEKTEMSLTIETAVQEKTNETMLEGIDKFDTAEAEDVTGQVKESDHVVTLVGTDLHSSSTVDQQTIDQSNVREIPDKELPSSCSVTEKESKETDKDTELLKQSGILQTNYLMSEPHVKSRALESSVTSEITTDNLSSREHTEPEVRGDHQSEDAESHMHDQEITPAEIHEITSEMLIHDATENPENLTDQTDMSGTQQSEFIVKITNDSLTSNEISSSDSKQDEHHMKESNAEALEQKNEDYHVHDTKKATISDIERADTALGQVSEVEGQVEDDVKPSDEQTDHQEKEGLFDKMEESESSLQILQSETNVHFDSQHQQSDTGFNPLGNRRKLGSSRRNRGRRHVKDPDAESHHTPTENVVGNTRDNELLETTEMSLTIETAMQGETNETMLEGTDKFNTAETEDVSDQVKENEHGGTLVSTDLNSSSTVDQQTIDQSNREMPDEELPSLCSVTDKESKETDEDTELLKQSGILQTNYFVSEPHVKSRALESSVTSEITTDKHDSREHTEPEVSDHQSEDAESKVHEQEIKPTEMPQTEHSSEMLIHDATENPEITSGNLTDQTEVSNTHQSDLILKSVNASPTNQEISNPDDKEDEHHTEESNVEPLEQKNEDYHVYDTKKAPIRDIERVDTAFGQVYEMEDQVEDDVKPSDEQTDHQEKEGLFSEIEESESSLQTLQSEVNSPFDSQHQQDDTGFNRLGNRRKLGSSRRNRGRRHVKDSDAESPHTPTEDVVGNTRDNEPLETTEMSLTIKTAKQEKTSETMLEGIDKLHTAETEDVSDQVKDNEHVVTLVGTDVHSSSTVDQQTMGQLNFREMPDKELPNVCSAPEIESKDRDKDTGLLRQDGNLQTNFLVSESLVESADLESSITPEITTDKHSQRKHTEIECTVEQAVFSSSKEDLSTDEEHKEPKVRGAHHLQDAVNEEEVKSTQVQEMYQIDNSSVMEIESSLQTLQSEMNTPLDSHPLDNSQSIKEQTHTGFSSTGNRRKLGSSRRNKGRLHVEDTTKISLVTETTRQEELKEQPGLDFKSTGEMRKIRSAVNDGENTDKIFAEDTLLSQNVMDNSTNLTRDIASSSGKHDVVKSNKEVSDEENKPMKESDHLNQLTGCDTVKTDLIQSPEVSVWKDDGDIQSISYHDDSVTARLIASDALEQEEAFHVQNTEALPNDKEISMQKTNDTLETVRDVIIKDLSTGGEGSMYVQGSGQDEDGEQFEDSMKKDHKDREINVELFSAEHSKTDAPSDIGLEEKLRAEPAMDVSEESGISSKQEKTHLDGSETLQVEPKQRRRKMGSTRRSQLNRKPEEKRTETIDSDFNTEADMKNLDNRGVVEELPVTVAAEVSPSEKAKPSLSPASHNEEVVDPVKFVQVADVRESERNVDVSVEPSQIDDFTAIEVDIASVLAGDNSINPLLSANTEDTTGESFVSLCETTQSAQNDEDRPESVSVTNNQALKSSEQPDVAVLDIVKSEVRGGTGEEHLSTQASEEEPDNMNEGAHNKNPEGKNRRRKLGSSRRNFSSRTKREDLHQKQEVDDEATEAATNVGDVKTESLSGIIEDEEQLHVADKDIGSEERKETVFETEEHGHTGESQENPVSGGQLVETEHQPTPNDPSAIPSSSPKQDSVSELTSSGKRRKMGSHRKSHGHQNNENQTAGGDRITDTQNGQDVRGTRDQHAIKTTEELREKSLGLDKIPEVDESDKTPSSNISTSKEGEHSRPVSDKTPQPVTPIQHRSADVRLGQESQTKFSLAGNARAADLRSNAYNVMMIGDSSVGKTSFIKRAQSGKFSLDLPASVGLDSCMWTVVVEGKSVVLQLWDTAGQERFHSITRQIFHKAQAFLLMYDITCSQSFSAVSYWASCIQEGAAEDVMVLLVGNKSDCAKRQVKTQEAESLAKEYNFEFMECSAATGENVVQSLETVARMLCQRDDTREEAMVLHKEPQKKKSSGCC